MLTAQLVRHLILTALLVVGFMPPASAQHVFVVNSVDDEVDDDLLDGICLSASGMCTLRAAIEQANDVPGADQILLTVAGSYVLTIAGDGEDVGATGDLDITDDVTISGLDPTDTVVDAAGLDRVFHVLSGTVTIESLTVTGGLAPPGEAGGGILVWSSTTTLVDLVIANNQAGASFEGGGIANEGGIVFLHRSSLVENVAECGAGFFNFGLFAVVENVTASGNTAACTGGGLLDASLGGTFVTHSTFVGNTPNNVAGTQDTLHLANNLLVPALAQVNCEIFPGTGNIDDGGNQIGADACFTIPVTADAHLVQDRRLDAASGQYVHRPLSPNPAIDGGDAGVCGLAASTDQRGAARPQGTACDSGAIELTPPRITSGAPGAAWWASNYFHQVSGVGEGIPTFAQISGALPGGLTLSPSGVISGSPTRIGTFAFVVRLTDEAGQTVDQSHSITVTGFAISLLGTPPPATLNAPYQFLFGASGNGPLFFSMEGALPRGLILLPGPAGLIVGTPVVVATTTFTLRVVDSAGQTASLTTSITVTDSAPTVTGLTNVTVEENRSIVPMTITVADDVTSPANLAVSVSTAGDHVLDGVSLTGTGSTRTLNLALAEDREGIASVMVTVSDGGKSSTATATIMVTPAPVPDPPTDLRAVRTGNAVRFTWSAPAAGAVPTFYVLEGGTLSGLVTVPIVVTGRTTSYQTVVPAGSWHYRVRSGNSAGTSRPSAEIAGTIAGVSNPGAPQGAVVSLGGAVTRLSWRSPAGGGPVTAWQIEVGSTPGATDLGVLRMPPHVFAVQGVLNPGRYSVRVRGVGPGGDGPASNEASFTVGAVEPCGLEVPDAPVLLPATVANGLVTVTWRPPANAAVRSYRLLAGTAAGLGDLAQIDLGPVTSLAAAPLPGQYFVTVLAMNDCGTSPASASNLVVVP